VDLNHGPLPYQVDREHAMPKPDASETSRYVWDCLVVTTAVVTQLVTQDRTFFQEGLARSVPCQSVLGRYA
jgi:hypothetical protein